MSIVSGALTRFELYGGPEPEVFGRSVRPEVSGLSVKTNVLLT